MTEAMTKWERIRAAVRKEETDRLPVAFYKHFPLEDMTVDGLANATIRWQKQYDWDLIKFSPTGVYSIFDYGAQTEWNPATELGIRTVKKFAISHINQWEALPRLKVTEGFLGVQLKALSRVAQAFHDEAPLLMTIFPPFTTARKLAGDRVFADMRLHPEKLKSGLEIITEMTISLAEEAIKAGAHGIFFGLQNANYRVMNRLEYAQFGDFYNLRVIKALRNSSEFIFLHNYGQDTMMPDLISQYNVDIINWDDRLTSPDPDKAKALFPGMVVGGIDEWGTFMNGEWNEVVDGIRNAIKMTGGRGLMIGPKVILSIDAPDDRLKAVREMFL